MATIKEAIEIENQRESAGEIHLFREGTFWRAYEMSAWLSVRCLHEFKATKRQMKDVEQPVVFVGFPASSFDKWVPKDMARQDVDDKHVVVMLGADRLPSIEPEELTDMFAIWKDNVELSPVSKSKEKVKQPSDTSRPTATAHSLTEVMKQILAYPLESKSPVDNMLFLAELKSQLSILL